NKLFTTDWIPVYLDLSATDETHATMLAKDPKAAPHRFPGLAQYDYTCYMDSKLGREWAWGELVDYGNLSELKIEYLIFENFILKDKAMILRNHLYGQKSVYFEIWDALCSQPRYMKEKNKIFAYVDKQLNSGLKDETDNHYATGFILRNMNHPDINKLNELWYSHIQECGMQCQISFFFAKQFYPDIIVGVDEVFDKKFISQVREPLPFGITYEGVMADLERFRLRP
ncbi:MAG: hypothetical protein EB127_21900, partial [Alphaproteobacteria bacterium]|nr:hypothetical protein [Alphaproteobacteria bacterium]